MSKLKRFIVKTEPGNPGNLKESVRVAFTITPVETGQPTHPYYPLAMEVTDFQPDDVTKVCIEWMNEVRFCTAEIEGRLVTWQACSEPMFLSQPGQAVTLASPTTWSDPAPCNDHASFVAINRSGSTANLVLALRTIYLAYRPLSDGCSIKTPSSFELQAYIVDKTIFDDTMLLPGELTRPVFTSPISCDALPNSSTWTLCRDDQGALRIKNNNYPGLGYTSTPSKTAAESVDRRDPLSEVLDRPAVTKKSKPHARRYRSG